MHPDEAMPQRVVVVGAGPAGLLTCIKLMAQNSANKLRTEVTLIDRGEDFGQLDDLTRKRSWMIGLSLPGLEALRSEPGLCEFVEEVGVRNVGAAVYPKGLRRMVLANPPGAGNTYTVDRNHIVARMARFLSERYGGAGLTQLYRTRVCFVDVEAKRILIRHLETGEERYIPYDVLLGCDGARSAVRAACVMEDREFDASIADIFNRYKSVHVPRPPALDGDLVHVFPGGVPNMNGAALLAPADHVNFVLGYYLNTPPDEELHSSDPAVVAAYLKKHLPVSLDFDAVAEQWVRQPWSTTPKVKCNKYHMANGRVLLMGDAAHATSPSIGMGMNTALADALAFGRLLEVHGANWDALLPAFSQERVKEGHALVELADHAYALSPKWMLVRLLEQVVRSQLHKFFPNYVAADPYQEIAQGMKLSTAYNALMHMPIFRWAKWSNEQIVCRHLETSWGMLKAPPRTGSGWWKGTTASPRKTSTDPTPTSTAGVAR